MSIVRGVGVVRGVDPTRLEPGGFTLELRGLLKLDRVVLKELFA